MEDPRSWDLLVSSLSLWDFKRDARKAWAYLVVLDLVRDEPGDRESYLRLVDEETSRGQITGGSLAWRVGYALRAIHLVTADSSRPDPLGELAAARLEGIRRAAISK